MQTDHLKRQKQPRQALPADAHGHNDGLPAGPQRLSDWWRERGDDEPQRDKEQEEDAHHSRQVPHVCTATQRRANLSNSGIILHIKSV